MGVPRGPLGFESITVSTAAQSIDVTAANNNGIKPEAAVVTVEDQAIRYRVDGTAPTASVGHEATDGDVITLTSRDEVELFRAIRRDGVDATLRVTRFVELAP